MPESQNPGGAKPGTWPICRTRIPAWRTLDDIDCAADRNIAFANKLLGSRSDRGGFIGVEKNGHSAGYWWQLSKSDDAFAKRYLRIRTRIRAWGIAVGSSRS